MKNKYVRYTLIALVVIGGACIGLYVARAIIGALIFLAIFAIFWVGFKIGQYFPRKKNQDLI